MTTFGHIEIFLPRSEVPASIDLSYARSLVELHRLSRRTVHLIKDVLLSHQVDRMDGEVLKGLTSNSYGPGINNSLLKELGVYEEIVGH